MILFNINMQKIEDLTNRIIKFRDVRDWKQFHNPKDMSLSLVLEASEVMEHFQWKNKEEVEKYIIERKEEVGEELADVFYWVLLMSKDLNIDIVKALENKLKKNEDKYPIEKARGKSNKYTDYQKI